MAYSLVICANPNLSADAFVRRLAIDRDDRRQTMTFAGDSWPIGRFPGAE